MERPDAKIDFELAWTPENFCLTFGFRAIDGSFVKEINGQEYKFKAIKTPEEFSKAQEVLRKGFGWEAIEIPPIHILALFEDTGGGCFSAFNKNGDMVGFAGGMGGGFDKLTGKPSLISSMLAMKGVENRSGGIGKELKIIQAYFAKQAGYDSMRWLYDPERGENASLNMRKLGARAEEFWIDKYGRMASDVFGGIPTDRFRAVWRFTDSDTISKILGLVEAPKLKDVKDVEIATETNLPNIDKVLVEISSDIDKIGTDSEKYDRRMKLRKILSTYFFDRNFIATQFVSEVENEVRKNYYVLEPQATLKQYVGR